jgi:RNA polymerase sigma factor (sigma-70 family)
MAYWAERLFRFKAKSDISKSASLPERQLAQGEREVTNDIPKGLKELEESEEERQQAQSRIAQLTAKEKLVFDFLVEGYTIKEIAKRLGISYSTVNTHMNAVYRKLGVNTRSQLIICYRQYSK